MSSFVSSLLSKSVNTIVGSSRHQDPSLQSLAKYEGVHNVDRKGISAGVKLISIAVEEFACGNQAIALDIYLSGLDKIIMSLPNLNDDKTRQAIKEKFISLEERLGIVANTGSPSMKSNDMVGSPMWFFSALTEPLSSPTAMEESRGDTFLKFKRIGSAITDAVVQCVVMFKQSPLPGLLYLLLSYFLHLIFWMDGHFHVVNKVQVWSISCIKQLLAADEKYHIHEFATEAICTLIRLYLKALVAYKETPGYLQEELPWPITMTT